MRNDIYQALYQHQFKDQNIAKFYLDRYIKFIESRRNRNLPKETYTEDHHIVPKSWNGNNSKENLIKLTAREHFIAHWILYATKNKLMCWAFKNFIDKRNYTLDGSEYRITSRLYESFRIEYSKTMSGEGNPNFGIPWSKERLEKFKKTINTKKSKENRIKELKNRIWVNNGKINHFCDREKAKEYINEGFVLGRLKEDIEKTRLKNLGRKDSPETKLKKKLSAQRNAKNHWTKSEEGRKWCSEIGSKNMLKAIRPKRGEIVCVNNGKETKRIKISEIPAFLNIGYSMGMLPKSYYKNKNERSCI